MCRGCGFGDTFLALGGERRGFLAGGLWWEWREAAGWRSSGLGMGGGEVGMEGNGGLALMVFFEQGDVVIGMNDWGE